MMQDFANWELETANIRGTQILIWLLVLASILGLAGSTSAQTKSALGELIDLQADTGLSIVDVDKEGIYVLSFRDKRFVKARPLTKDIDVTGGLFSPDGKQIAVGEQFPTGTYRTPTGMEIPTYGVHLSLIRSDGSDLRRFKNIEATAVCWSADSRYLVLAGIQQVQGPQPGFQLLDLGSGQLIPLPEVTAVHSPCSSADGQEIVYGSKGGLRIYNVANKQSRPLTPGTHATWSPDGKWIAYLDGERYCFVSPDGSRKMPCFRKENARSPLWWSPDSKFAAFVSPTRWYEGWFEWGLQEMNGLRLRVRRVTDGSESWVLRFSGKGTGTAFFQWAILPEAKRKSR